MVEILGEQEREADQICQHGIDLCEEKEFEEAHKEFLRAHELDPNSAKIHSWLGYTTGLVEKRVARALEFCRMAIDSQIPDALFYRNIGVVYLLQNNKRAAIGAFAKGLQIDKGNRKILNEWSKLGFRRKPTLRFLSRDHWLNKKLGQWTYKKNTKPS